MPNDPMKKSVRASELAAMMLLAGGIHPGMASYPSYEPSSRKVSVTFYSENSQWKERFDNRGLAIARIKTLYPEMTISKSGQAVYVGEKMVASIS